MGAGFSQPSLRRPASSSSARNGYMLPAPTPALRDSSYPQWVRCAPCRSSAAIARRAFVRRGVMGPMLPDIDRLMVEVCCHDPIPGGKDPIALA